MNLIRRIRRNTPGTKEYRNAKRQRGWVFDWYNRNRDRGRINRKRWVINNREKALKIARDWKARNQVTKNIGRIPKSIDK